MLRAWQEGEGVWRILCDRGEADTHCAAVSSFQSSRCICVAGAAQAGLDQAGIQPHAPRATLELSLPLSELWSPCLQPCLHMVVVPTPRLDRMKSASRAGCRLRQDQQRTSHVESIAGVRQPAAEARGLGFGKPGVLMLLLCSRSPPERT